jgi:hypothetical protein
MNGLGSACRSENSLGCLPVEGRLAGDPLRNWARSVPTSSAGGGLYAEGGAVLDSLAEKVVRQGEAVEGRER